MKIFRQGGCQNCILSVHKNIFRKSFSLEKIFNIFIVFGFWEKIIGLLVKDFWTCGENFSAGLLKLHSTCSEEHYRAFKKIFPIVNERANIV